MKITVKCITAVVLILGSPVSGVAQVTPSENSSRNVDQGPALVAELCTKCHNLDEVVRLRQSRQEWEDTVYSMVARGAPIFMDEVEVIVDYLSRVYPPSPR